MQQVVDDVLRLRKAKQGLAECVWYRKTTFAPLRYHTASFVIPNYPQAC